MGSSGPGIIFRTHPVATIKEAVGFAFAGAPFEDSEKFNGVQKEDVGMLFIKVLASLLIIFSCFAWSQAMPRLEEKRQPLVYLHYYDVSAFHGNGEALWLNKQGLLIAQVIENRPDTVDKHYKLYLGQEEMSAISKQISTWDFKSLAVKDRSGIPDEVRVKFGFQDERGQYHAFEIWEDDWKRQGKELQLFRKIVADLLELAKASKPVSISRVSPGGSLWFWPQEFERL